MTLVDDQLEDLRKTYPKAQAKAFGDGSLGINIPNFPLPPGWNHSKIGIYFVLPVGYPIAQPDCFWTEDSLRLAGGPTPKNAQVQIAPFDTEPKLWFSWHATPWDPNRDNLTTYARIIADRLRHAE